MTLLPLSSTRSETYHLNWLQEAVFRYAFYMPPSIVLVAVLLPVLAAFYHPHIILQLHQSPIIYSEIYISYFKCIKFLS